MNLALFTGLINNVALLTALIVIYEVTENIDFKRKKIMQVINGVLIGFIGLAIMTIPFTLETGIIFDTRSILVSVTALIFGPVPAIISGVMLMLYRLTLGGVGALAGILVIASSAVIGIFWRGYVLPKKFKHRWINIYLFGIVVHIAMIMCMFVMPWPTSVEVVKQISMPVMFIYPLGTVLLSLVLLKQKERQESNGKIGEAEARYTSIFNNNHAIMLLINPENGNIIDANPAAVSFYGWTAEVIKSMSITQINIISADDMKDRLRRSASRQQNHFISRHRKASGEIADVEIYSGPIVFHGNVLIYSIVHDISDRVNATKRLQDSEERFRLLIESAPEAIFIITNGKIVFLNYFAVSLFGANSAEELLDTPVMNRVHEDYYEIIRERIALLKKDGGTVPPIEEVFLRLDGTEVRVESTSVAIKYEQHDGILVFARKK